MRMPWPYVIPLAVCLSCSVGPRRPNLTDGLPRCVVDSCGASYTVKTMWDAYPLYHIDELTTNTLSLCTNLEGDITHKDQNSVKASVRACYEKKATRDEKAVEKAMGFWAEVLHGCSLTQPNWDACYGRCLNPTVSGSPTVVASLTVCGQGYQVAEDSRCCWEKSVDAKFGWKTGPVVPKGFTVEISARGEWNVVRQSGPVGNGVPAGAPTFLLNRSREGIEGQLIVKDGNETLRGMSGATLNVDTPGPLAFMANDESSPIPAFGHDGYADNTGALTVRVCYRPK